MSQAAQKQALQPANDSDYADQPSLDKHESTSQADSQVQSVVSIDNPVKRAVEEFSGLMDNMDDLREVLRAHGVPFRTTKLIVELGLQGNPDKQAITIDSAMEHAEQELGEGCLTRSELESHIETIVNLERDLLDCRAVAREEGLDAKTLAMLTQMVQRNPGDNGAKAINTFLGYAVAYGVKTDQLSDIVGELTPRESSVLPQIPRRADVVEVVSRKKIAQDVLTGLGIGIVVIWMLL